MRPGCVRVCSHHGSDKQIRGDAHRLGQGHRPRYRLDMPDYPAEWRRALGVLADTPEGATEALLAAHGFATTTISGLIAAGLATSTTGVILADGQPVQLTRVRITDAGRAALAR